MSVFATVRRAVLLVSLLVLTACGSNGSATATCTTPAACGGDVVGKWRITSGCLTESVHDLDCAGTTATISSVKVEGTLEFGADGSVVSAETVTQSGHYDFPSTCLSQSCAETATKLQAANPDLHVTCGASGDVCECPFSVVYRSNDSDTYTVSGNNLTTTSSTDGKQDTATYCVKGADFSTVSSNGTVIHATRE
jgi:hypothetical protein